MDYSKVLSADSTLTNGGFINNESYLILVHLNYYLSVLLKNQDDIEIIDIKRSDLYTKVIFNATIRLEGEIISKYKDSELTFSNKDDAVVRLRFNDGFETESSDKSKETGIYYQSKKLSGQTEINLHKNKDNKFYPNWYSWSVYICCDEFI